MATSSSSVCKMFKVYLKKASEVKPPEKLTLTDFKKISAKFNGDGSPCQTPQLANLEKYDRSPKRLEAQINSAYPLCHEKLLNHIIEFIEFKKTNGSSIEKEFYVGMEIVDFVDRLIKKRPITFYGIEDRYMLYSYKTGYGGFENIGTNKESPPLLLEDYISYDEMKVSALLSISSQSCFVNDGARDNNGKPGKEGSFAPHGVIVGQVGARLKRPNVMEWQDCVITTEQNVRGNSTNDLQYRWENLWKVRFPSYRDAVRSYNKDDYIYLSKARESPIFNVRSYQARIQMTAEILLTDANSRAEAEGIKAYVHVVGLGLGVWRASRDQDRYYVDAWGHALKCIDSSNIAVVDFSWIDARTCLGTPNDKRFPDTNVTIKFSKRLLHGPVPVGTLLVCNFAWDGNSLPGNEFWMNKLGSTGDSAAACSSSVAELHNHYINPLISGNNLHVASRYGVLHIADYAKMYLSGKLDQPPPKKTTNLVSSSQEKSYRTSSQEKSNRTSSQEKSKDLAWSPPLKRTTNLVSSSQEKSKDRAWSPPPKRTTNLVSSSQEKSKDLAWSPDNTDIKQHDQENSKVSTSTSKRPKVGFPDVIDPFTNDVNKNMDKSRNPVEKKQEPESATNHCKADGDSNLSEVGSKGKSSKPINNSSDDRKFYPVGLNKSNITNSTHANAGHKNNNKSRSKEQSQQKNNTFQSKGRGRGRGQQQVISSETMVSPCPNNGSIMAVPTVINKLKIANKTADLEQQKKKKIEIITFSESSDQENDQFEDAMEDCNQPTNNNDKTQLKETEVATDTKHKESESSPSTGNLSKVATDTKHKESESSPSTGNLSKVATDTKHKESESSPSTGNLSKVATDTKHKESESSPSTGNLSKRQKKTKKKHKK